MSNFICEYCGAEILEGPDGRYITGCEHYPLDEGKEGAVPPLEQRSTAGGVEIILAKIETNSKITLGECPAPKGALVYAVRATEDLEYAPWINIEFRGEGGWYSMTRTTHEIITPKTRPTFLDRLFSVRCAPMDEDVEIISEPGQELPLKRRDDAVMGRMPCWGWKEYRVTVWGAKGCEIKVISDELASGGD